jgi:3-oxoacid CoA-transferase B subunit
MPVELNPRERIAKRLAEELRRGEAVNLGVGIPTLVARFLDNGSDISIQVENGLLGAGPPPSPGMDADASLVDAGKHPITEVKGAVYFDSAASFAMIRGGHIDVAIMGALQVDARGRIANWHVPGQPVYGVGGAMDLLVGARRVFVGMTHVTTANKPKILKACSLPLTADRSVDLIVTELAVFRMRDDRLILTELMPGVDFDLVRRSTAAGYEVDLLSPATEGSAATRVTSSINAGPDVR